MAHQAELRSIEAALLETRLAAESMDKPVLAYFIDMAIAEVRDITPVSGGPRFPTPGRIASRGFWSCAHSAAGSDKSCSETMT